MADGPNAYSDLGAAFKWSTRVAAETGPESALVTVRQVAKGGRVKNSNAAVAPAILGLKGFWLSSANPALRF